MDNLQQELRVASKLIDYLRKSKDKISWNRHCLKDGTIFQGEEIRNKPDRDFSTTTYHASLHYGDINLEHHIDWQDSWNTFHIEFKKYGEIGLKPRPKEIGLLSRSCDNHGVPRFQASYSGWGCEYAEAKGAMENFIENGKELVPFFVDMGQEAIEKYNGLIDRFKQHKDKGIIAVF